ncbi:UDP-2,3-diacylglucosamine diphosphatase [Singulisphaera rosea]
MPAYFASDVHLRLDRPERGRRFARWVDRLGPQDSLTIVGDLCDFWLVSRQLSNAAAECPGLIAAAEFRRRGGTLTILAGNHDLWLGEFYRETLDATFVEEPYVVEAHGKRLLLVHGHHSCGRSAWKAWMEGTTFLRAFRNCPKPAASALDYLLERSNDRGRSADDARQLAAFREFALGREKTIDLVVMGHVHLAVDESRSPTRLVVLGGWHRQSSYLRVDDSGTTLVVEADPGS